MEVTEENKIIHKYEIYSSKLACDFLAILI
jgi:hypothetical protein